MKKIHIFYGWYIVAALFFVWAFVGGIVMNSFTAYIEPLSDKFGWNYTSIAFAVSLHHMAQVIFFPVAGLFVDRWSVRKLVFTGIFFTAIGIFLLSRITSLSQFYAIYFFIGITTSTCIATIPLTVVGRWFRKKISLATGILMAGAGSSGLLVPLVTRIIDMFGWQNAMAILGTGLMVIISPLALLIRPEPEKYGYLPDGDINAKPDIDEVQTPVEINENQVGVKQALKSRVFWHITIGYVFLFLVGLAVTTNIMPYLSTIGIDRKTASFLVSALVIGGLFGRLGFGWLGDRLNKRYVAISGIFLVGLCLLVLIYVVPVAGWIILPAIIVFSFGYGGAVTMQSVLLKEYFGAGNLGSIIGFSFGITRSGIIVGPPLASWLYERFDNYNIAWFILAGFVFMNVVIHLTNPSVSTMKQRRAERDT
jgi:sugar phosphate permease